jgi:hypothetical protein
MAPSATSSCKQRGFRQHDRTNPLSSSADSTGGSQLALAEEKLARARIVAPFDGIVVSGDLSQMLGSPVEKGKTLFELAPLDAYRVIIHVGERDVRYVSVHQHGILALEGMPGDPLPLSLTKITPVTVAEEGRNSFRVEARLIECIGWNGGRCQDRNGQGLMWIWTRSVVEWLRCRVEDLPSGTVWTVLARPVRCGLSAKTS